jgi:soluble cytochrome b562
MKILLMILVFFVSNKSYAQTYEEWFQQSKTQKKYLLQQIAALKVYIGYAEKGYSIATKGLSTIQDIKHGDFNLHNNFFNSLSAVNPTVKKYSKVASIILMQITIAKQVHTTIKDCRNGKQLTDTELKYLQHVFDNLLDDCVKNLDELIALITDGETQMKDDERIKRIDKLYADMQDKQVFTQSFSHTAEGLSVQRRNDAYDIEIEKKLNGLK